MAGGRKINLKTAILRKHRQMIKVLSQENYSILCVFWKCPVIRHSELPVVIHLDGNEITTNKEVCHDRPPWTSKWKGIITVPSRQMQVGCSHVTWDPHAEIRASVGWVGREIRQNLHSSQHLEAISQTSMAVYIRPHPSNERDKLSAIRRFISRLAHIYKGSQMKGAEPWLVTNCL